MEAFAKLLENIIYSPSRNQKIKLIIDYFKNNSDPERGYALGILTSNLKLSKIKNHELKKIVFLRFDENLFNLSYDYIGDTAETISLIWRSKNVIHTYLER